MQLGLINAIVAAAPAPASPLAAGPADASYHPFARLLGDAGEKTAAGDQGKPQSVADTTNDAASTNASAALAAQELSAHGTDPVQALVSRLSQPITQDQATAALATLDALPANKTDTFTAQLHDALIAIQSGSGTDSVASLIQKLAAAQQATAPTDLVQIIKQTLQIIVPRPAADAQAAAEPKSKDEPTDANLNALAQSLQASWFQPAGNSSPAAADTTDEPKKSRDMVEIIPLSMIATTQVAAPVVQPVATQASSAPVSSVQAIASSAQSSPGAQIPSLALNDDDADALPQVHLPSMGTSDHSAADTHKPLDALSALAAVGDRSLNATIDAAKAAVNISANAATPNLSLAKPNTDKGSAVNDPSAAAAATDTPAAPSGTAPFANVVAAANKTDMTAANAVVATAAQTTDEKSPDSKPDASITPSAAITAGAVAANQAASPAITVQAPSALNHTPIAEQVHVAISQAAKDGINQVTIQLDPADLGRVEVKMHTGADGQTQIAFTVDKPSTLDSLARNAHGLERSLQESGVKTDAGNMQFNLRQQPQTAADSGTGSGRQQAFNQPTTDDSTTTTTTMAAIPAIATTRNYTLNIRDGLDIHA